ncbi:hypothetical protein [Absidia glauca]|uniref:Uncharacterized protein n=1 Tax=Absidia glauca TaxID=4829 RepID=A0A163JWN9_ABSGL|nr:hypothetical protein [Absidia glauca]
MVAFLLAPSVSSSSCGAASSSAVPEAMPGWQPSVVDWSLWIKREVVFYDLVDLRSPLLHAATGYPALILLSAIPALSGSVPPSALVLCSAFSPPGLWTKKTTTLHPILTPRTPGFLG